MKDLNWQLEVARRKKRWKSKEEELRTRDKEDADGSLGAVYHDPTTWSASWRAARRPS
jgi:hypothetical protein